MNKALEDIAAERQSQRDKGFTAAFDDEYNDSQLLLAALGYLHHSVYPKLTLVLNGRPVFWPLNWDEKFWKPTTARRDLVKAAALITAEIERLDRL